MRVCALVKIFFICMLHCVQAMEPKKIKKFPKGKRLDFVLRQRSIKRLAAICEFVIANNSKNNKKNIKKVLKTIKEHINSYNNILLLLSEELPYRFEQFYETEGEWIRNFYYSGEHVVWSQYNEESGNNKLTDYIYAFDVLNGNSISGFYKGPYSAQEVSNVAISPFTALNGSAFMIIHLNTVSVTSCAFAADGLRHAMGSSDGSILIKSKNNDGWDSTILNSNIGYAITALKFVPQGFLYSSDEHGGNFIWWNKSHNRWIGYRLPIEESINLILSNDSNLVALQHKSKKKISIIDWNSNKLRTIKIPGNLIAITPLNNLLIVYNNVLVLFSPKENCIIKYFSIPFSTTEIYPNLFMIAGAPLFFLKTCEKRTKSMKQYFYGGSPAQSLVLRNYLLLTKNINKEVDVLYLPKKFSDEEIIAMVKRNNELSTQQKEE
jgi:hypothetical protein